MKKSQQKSSNNPQMTPLVLGLQFQEITRLVPQVWQIGNFGPQELHFEERSLTSHWEFTT